MVYFLDNNQVGFPDPHLTDDPRDLLCYGGSLGPEWLLNAYYLGIFPWYTESDIPFWFCPRQRMVLRPEEFHCSKSLARTIKSGRFETRVDTAFEEVIRHCASMERGEPLGTWIGEDFIKAFCDLHRLGLAHSFETYQDGQLVGGLYGVSLSNFFFGESMFHTVTDASKVAFARMADFGVMHNFRLIDAQMYTSHLASLGAYEIPRDDFLDILAEQDIQTTYSGCWPNNSVVLLIGGNQGDRMTLLMQAISLIADQIGRVSAASTIFETAPWGFEAEQNFLNQALVVDTDLTAQEVLRRALAIETQLGRVRPTTHPNNPTSNSYNYTSRPIDIDLIFYNNSIVDTPSLTLPHPRMHLRRFVLEPLSKIIPHYKHPIFQKSILQLLDECQDKGPVEPYL